MERVGKGRPRIDAKKREDRVFIDALRVFLGLKPLYYSDEDSTIAKYYGPDIRPNKDDYL